jgi:hypothetical protein
MKHILLITAFVANSFIFRTKLRLPARAISFNNLNTQSVINLIINGKDIDGYDHRYLEYNNSDIRQPIITQTLVTAEEIHMFNKNNYKLNLLNRLLDPNVSTVEKILELELYEQHGDSYKYSNNINAGGLFNDWNMTII